MALQGSQKFVVLLCKFSDTSDIEQNPVSFYQDLVVNRGTGGLNDYWIAASLGAINLDGSQVFGWTTLQTTRTDFLNANPGRGDKVRAALAAFGLNIDDYAGCIAIFNTGMTDGGSEPPSWILVQPGDANVTFLAHESGHLFGLDHSFDHSTRQLQFAQAGEYFDRYDIMSAMNVDSDTQHRFSPRGPLLNVANLDRMGWLPPGRLWHPMQNSSYSYQIELVALEYPEVQGNLAAQMGNGGVYAEFRINEGFDGGLARPCVLFHEPAKPNSYILAKPSIGSGIGQPSYDYDWLPGDVWGTPTWLFEQAGGVRVTIVGFDLQRKTARLQVQVKAFQLPQVTPEVYYGLGIGQLAHNGVILVLRDGRLVPVPVPDPEPFIGELRGLLRAVVRQQLAAVLRETIAAELAQQANALAGVGLTWTNGAQSGFPNA